MPTRRTLLILTIAIASTLLASAANAASCTTGTSCVQIQYSLSGTTSLPGVGVIFPTGSAALEYRAAAADDVREGPVHLISLTQSAFFDLTVGGLARLVGVSAINAPASQSGTLAYPDSVNPFGALLLGTLTATGNALVHCVDRFPGICAAGGLPNSVPQATSGATSITANLFGTAQNILNATFFDGDHQLTFMSTGTMGTLATTVLSEVERTFVPEPNPGLLVALGLLALVASRRAGRHLRTSRRS